ncbi:type VI secretion system protein TssA [Roseomonas sp. NAR14]|uniref:Type VI secretion system protein TssA n=1 Tax=Roseomonas acroporae TaxID=2937791 RepID=A0A9X1Y8Q7_9PROT|nr:type VI secretion system protein TssA [Roseomonas acroporae]MCK8785140.1 type VI secretion system protein TssA [Roseomonas acroporae]
MAEALLDLETLLAPLPAGGGAGEDPREDITPASLYQQLRDRRFEARAVERRQDSGDPEAPEGVPTQWRDVLSLGQRCLAGQGRDFEVGAWLAEALVRLTGLSGLAEAARLLDGLLDAYWENGFPRLDGEDGLDDRAIALGGLSGSGVDGTLMQPLRRIPLFRRATDGTDVGLHLWKQAEDTAGLPAEDERKQQRLDAGVPDFERLSQEAKQDLPFVRAMRLEARAAQAAWQALDERFRERFAGTGVAVPSTRQVVEALGQMLEVADRIAGPLPREAAPAMAPDPRPAGAADMPAAQGTAPAAAAAPGAAWSGQVPAGAIASREEAIHQLGLLAEFFRRTEPHSPLAYTLAEAVRRARMPLPELLAEVLPDDMARRMMLTMLGIRPADGMATLFGAAPAAAEAGGHADDASAPEEAQPAAAPDEETGASSSW